MSTTTFLDLAAADAAKAEGNVGSTAFTFTITRSGLIAVSTSVDYAVTGNGATAGDFAGGSLPTGTVTFAPGETSKLVTVNVAGDTAFEANEGFTVTLSSGAATIGIGSATGTILNDDTQPSLSIAATSAVKAEGDSGSTPFTFTVTRSGDTSGASSANWAVTGSSANAAAGGDFAGGVLPSGTVSFAAGETSKLVTVNVAGDTVFEQDEGFTVTLSGASGATLGTSAATGTIQNDDAQASLSIAATDAVKNEGNAGSTAFTFTVTRSGDTSGASSANWAVTGSSANAAAGGDFTGGALPSGTVSFAAGETSKLVTVNIAGDTVFEQNEGFTVTLSGASGATLGTSAATGTIQNDDAQASLSITASDAVKNEGNAGSTAFTFKVSRSGDTSGASSANWGVTGSGANAATAGDFAGGALPSGTVSFAAGETSKVITVDVTGDTAFEAHEGFTVTLSGASGATLGTAAATGTIQNDDVLPNAAPSAAADVATVSEKASLAIDVLANDTDADAGDGKALVSVSATAKGASVAIVNGQVVYVADADAFDLLAAGQSTTDSFTYVMRDTAGLTSSATVTVTVNGVANGVTQTGGTGGDALSGTLLDEKLDGAGGDDTVGGAGGTDTLVGGAGNDTLDGGSGIDSLSGGDGADTVAGGAGDDVIAGGRGADVFLFGPGFGHDTLIDFRPGEDDIRLVGTGLTSFADVLAHASQVGFHVVIVSATGDSLQLNNVLLGSLQSSDFLFA